MPRVAFLRDGLTGSGRRLYWAVRSPGAKEEFKKRMEEADPLTRAIPKMPVDRPREATAPRRAGAS